MEECSVEVPTANHASPQVGGRAPKFVTIFRLSNNVTYHQPHLSAEQSTAQLAPSYSYSSHKVGGYAGSFRIKGDPGTEIRFSLSL